MPHRTHHRHLVLTFGYFPLIVLLHLACHTDSAYSSQVKECLAPFIGPVTATQVHTAARPVLKRGYSTITGTRFPFFYVFKLIRIHDHLPRYALATPSTELISSYKRLNSASLLNNSSILASIEAKSFLAPSMEP